MDFARGVLQRARLTPLESKVHECTNGDPWGPHGKDLSELASCTHSASAENRRQVVDFIWRRLGERPEQWRSVYKALSVVEYLLCHGSLEIVAELRAGVRRVAALSSFHYKDAEGKDQGINVRVKSSTVAAVRLRSYSFFARLTHCCSCWRTAPQ